MSKESTSVVVVSREERTSCTIGSEEATSNADESFQVLFEIEHSVECKRLKGGRPAHFYKTTKDSKARDELDPYKDAADAVVGCLCELLAEVHCSWYSIIVNRRVLRAAEREGAIGSKFQGDGKKPEEKSPGSLPFGAVPSLPSEKQMAATLPEKAGGKPAAVEDIVQPQQPSAAGNRRSPAARYPRPGSFEVTVYNPERRSHRVIYSKYQKHKLPASEEEIWSELLPFMLIFAGQSNDEALMNRIADFATERRLVINLRVDELREWHADSLLLTCLLDSLIELKENITTGDPDLLTHLIEDIPHGLRTKDVVTAEKRLDHLCSVEKKVSDALLKIGAGLVTSGVESLRLAIEVAEQEGLCGSMMTAGTECLLGANDDEASDPSQEEEEEDSDEMDMAPNNSEQRKKAQTIKCRFVADDAGDAHHKVRHANTSDASVGSKDRKSKSKTMTMRRASNIKKSMSEALHSTNMQVTAKSRQPMKDLQGLALSDSDEEETPKATKFVKPRGTGKFTNSELTKIRNIGETARKGSQRRGSGMSNHARFGGSIFDKGIMQQAEEGIAARQEQLEDLKLKLQTAAKELSLDLGGAESVDLAQAPAPMAPAGSMTSELSQIEDPAAADAALWDDLISKMHSCVGEHRADAQRCREYSEAIKVRLGCAEAGAEQRACEDFNKLELYAQAQSKCLSAAYIAKASAIIEVEAEREWRHLKNEEINEARDKTQKALRLATVYEIRMQKVLNEQAASGAALQHAFAQQQFLCELAVCDAANQENAASRAEFSELLACEIATAEATLRADSAGEAVPKQVEARHEREGQNGKKQKDKRETPDMVGVTTGGGKDPELAYSGALSGNEWGETAEHLRTAEARATAARGASAREDFAWEATENELLLAKDMLAREKAKREANELAYRTHMQNTELRLERAEREAASASAELRAERASAQQRGGAVEEAVAAAPATAATSSRHTAQAGSASARRAASPVGAGMDLSARPDIARHVQTSADSQSSLFAAEASPRTQTAVPAVAGNARSMADVQPDSQQEAAPGEAPFTADLHELEQDTVEPDTLSSRRANTSTNASRGEAPMGNTRPHAGPGEAPWGEPEELLAVHVLMADIDTGGDPLGAGSTGEAPHSTAAEAQGSQREWAISRPVDLAAEAPRTEYNVRAGASTGEAPHEAAPADSTGRAVQAGAGRSETPNSHALAVVGATPNSRSASHSRHGSLISSAGSGGAPDLDTLPSHGPSTGQAPQSQRSSLSEPPDVQFVAAPTQGAPHSTGEAPENERSDSESVGLAGNNGLAANNGTPNPASGPSTRQAANREACEQAQMTHRPNPSHCVPITRSSSSLELSQAIEATALELANMARDINAPAAKVLAAVRYSQDEHPRFQEIKVKLEASLETLIAQGLASGEFRTVLAMPTASATSARAMGEPTASAESFAEASILIENTMSRMKTLCSDPGARTDVGMASHCSAELLAREKIFDMVALALRHAGESAEDSLETTSSMPPSMHMPFDLVQAYTGGAASAPE